MIDKHDRVAGLIRECAGEYIARESNRQALLTPTRVIISSDFKRVTIVVSVFPQSEIKNALLFLNRHKDMFRTYLKQHVRLRVLPFIIFAIEQDTDTPETGIEQ